jgi:hypothetical protein
MKAAILQAASAAFRAIGDLKESVTYRRTNNTYDAVTGVNTVVNSDTTIQAVFTSYSEFELNGSAGLQTFDVKMVVLATSLPSPPMMQVDRVIRAGREYNVLQSKTDPVGATYTIQLRAA